MRWNRLASLSMFAAATVTTGLGSTQTVQAEPVPAVIAAKATRSVLTNVTHTGKRFVAVGDRGHVLLSEDGQNWRQVPSPVSRMLTSVFFINENTGWAVGYDFAIIKTTDGGETWQLQNHEAEPGWPFYSVYFLNPQRGFVMGERGSLRVTDNGGQNWTTIETDLTELGMHINGMTRLPSGALVMVGEKGLTARSMDEGATWEMLTEPYVGSFFGVVPLGENGFVTYGLRGNAYAVDDVAALVVQDPLEWDEYGRETIEDADKLAELGWRFLPNPITESLFGGTVLPNGDIVLAGVNGSVVRLPVGGDALQPMNNPGDTTLGDLVAQNGNLVMVGVAGISRLNIQ